MECLRRLLRKAYLRRCPVYTEIVLIPLFLAGSRTLRTPVCLTSTHSLWLFGRARRLGQRYRFTAARSKTFARTRRGSSLGHHGDSSNASRPMRLVFFKLHRLTSGRLLFRLKCAPSQSHCAPFMRHGAERDQVLCAVSENESPARDVAKCVRRRFSIGLPVVRSGAIRERIQLILRRSLPGASR